MHWTSQGGTITPRWTFDLVRISDSWYRAPRTLFCENLKRRLMSNNIPSVAETNFDFDLGTVLDSDRDHVIDSDPGPVVDSNTGIVSYSGSATDHSFDLGEFWYQDKLPQLHYSAKMLSFYIRSVDERDVVSVERVGMTRHTDSRGSERRRPLVVRLARPVHRDQLLAAE
ncbi:hypothetical protein EVAR_21830_1 [Eumeta japonica]|uniref:Uncharacterized protein n=1 Tax=Eumeta variegata TaxID=151549 RepID=A0A4C1V8F7_EUMVA|nr:hypothetical protein EVAR_21830_1 [Eumeta japonica]